MELWDAYDRNCGRIDGVTLVRGEPVPEGLFHLVSEIIVRHLDGCYLIMQRDRWKHLGGMWEATAGGSALQGENALDCAIRELREETGIGAEGLVEIGRVVHDAHRTIYAEFLCVTNCDKDSVALQPGETSAYRWITLDELRSMPSWVLATHRIQQFIPELR